MPKYSPEEIQERYKKLSPSVREVFLGVDTAEIMQEIGKKHGLMIDKIGEMADETGLVILGLTHPKDFVGNLASRLGVDKIKAREIADEVNEKVFHKIREELRAIHNIKADVATQEEDLKMQTEPETKIETPAKPAPQKNSLLEKPSALPIIEKHYENLPAISDTEPRPAETPAKPGGMPKEPKSDLSPFEHKIEKEEIFKAPAEITEYEPPMPPEKTESAPQAPAKPQQPKSQVLYSGGKDPYREPVE